MAAEDVLCLRQHLADMRSALHVAVLLDESCDGMSRCKIVLFHVQILCGQVQGGLIVQRSEGSKVVVDDSGRGLHLQCLLEELVLGEAGPAASFDEGQGAAEQGIAVGSLVGSKSHQGRHDICIIHLEQSGTGCIGGRSGSHQLLDVVRVGTLGEQAVVVLGIGLKALKQVGIVVLGDDLCEALDSGIVDAILANQLCQGLIGFANAAFASERHEQGTGLSTPLLQCREHSLFDIAVESHQSGRGVGCTRAVQCCQEGRQSLSAANLAGCLYSGSRELGIRRTHSTHDDICLRLIAVVAQPAEDVGSGIGRQLRIRLDDLRIEARQLQLVGQRQSGSADCAVGVLQCTE